MPAYAYSKCSSSEPGDPTKAKVPPKDAKVMEQLLRDQRVALEKLLAEQQQSVQRLFNEHQKAMQGFLTQGPLQPVPPPKRSQERAAPSSDAARAPMMRELHGRNRSLSDSEGSSEEDLLAGVGMKSTTQQSLIESRNGIQRCMLPITQSGIFKGIFSTAIILNTIFLGYRVHVEIRDTLEKMQLPENADHSLELPSDYKVFEQIATGFFVLFSFEMALRIIADQGQFCCGPGKYWNVFELVCLASMTMEQLPEEDSKQLLGNVSTLRLFRLLRIFRAARAIRLLQYLRQLRLMLYSVVSCIVSMFWAVMLLLIIICIYALYLEDTSLAYLRETYNETTKSTELKEVMTSLSANWNGMGCAVRSLFYSISGGADWGDLAEPFWTVGHGSGLSYMAFVILTIFGLLNILVGIFVQEAEELSKWDKDFVVDGFVTKKKEKEKDISDLFDLMDTEQNGVLSLKELSDALEDDAIAAQFAHLEVEVDKVSVLFHVLDVDGNGKITREEFIQGLAKLHGHANATDVADLLIEEQKMNNKMDQLKDWIGQRIDTLQDKLVAPDSHGGGRTTRGWNAGQGPGPQGIHHGIPNANPVRNTSLGNFPQASTPNRAMLPPRQPSSGSFPQVSY